MTITLRTIMLLVAVFVMAVAAGCATTPVAGPDPGLAPPAAEDPGELRLCPPPPYLPPPVLPAWPLPPGDGATKAELDDWYARCAALVKARERLLIEDGLTCREALEAYRALSGPG